MLLCKHLSALNPVCCCRNSGCPELLTELVKLGSFGTCGPEFCSQDFPGSKGK